VAPEFDVVHDDAAGEVTVTGHVLFYDLHGRVAGPPPRAVR
jgi:hypothetical protein